MSSLTVSSGDNASMHDIGLTGPFSSCFLWQILGGRILLTSRMISAWYFLVTFEIIVFILGRNDARAWHIQGFSLNCSLVSVLCIGCRLFAFSFKLIVGHPERHLTFHWRKLTVRISRWNNRRLSTSLFVLTSAIPMNRNIIGTWEEDQCLLWHLALEDLDLWCPCERDLEWRLERLECCECERLDLLWEWDCLLLYDSDS